MNTIRETQHEADIRITKDLLTWASITCDSYVHFLFITCLAVVALASLDEEKRQDRIDAFIETLRLVAKRNQ